MLGKIAYLVGSVLFVVAFILHFKWEFPANILFVLSFLLSGTEIMVEGFSDTVKHSMAKKKFQPNIHLLMAIAAIGAIIIGKYEEAALLIVIFGGAHILEEYAEGKSQREITKLLNLHPTEARRVLDNGHIEVVPVSELQVGDIVQVLNGAQIPIDGEIIEGTITVDESTINGESIPREKTVGDLVFGTTINGDQAFKMRVIKDSSETVYAKIIELVRQSQANITPTATWIKKIEPIYVTGVLIFVPLVMIFLIFVLGMSVEAAVYRGLVLLIGMSPCALAASAIPATLAGISTLAKRGVLFKGGAHLSNLAHLRAIAFDKTGTLTTGHPVVTDFILVDQTQDETLLKTILVNMERQSNHPLAQAIVMAFEADSESLALTVKTQIGVGISSQYQGDMYRVVKPTDEKSLQKMRDDFSESGKTVVYMLKNENVVAVIALMDVANEKAKEAVRYFKESGIQTVMITGDGALTGMAVAKAVGVHGLAANVMPEDKAQIITQLQEDYREVAMVGDGVNDAPALVQANIGVAMGDGTDVAIEVADVVVMQNDLGKLRFAHQVAKKLDAVVKQNIIFSSLVIITLVILNLFGMANIAFGVILHEGSTIIVLLNGLRLLLMRESDEANKLTSNTE